MELLNRPHLILPVRADGGVVEVALGRVTHPGVAELTRNCKEKFNCFYLLYMCDTILVAKEHDVCRYLVALVTIQSQGIDAMAQVLLHLSCWQTAAFAIHHGRLSISNVAIFDTGLVVIGIPPSPY